MLRKLINFFLLIFSFCSAQGIMDDPKLWVKTEKSYAATWLVTKCDVSEMRYLSGLTNVFEDYSQEIQINYSFDQVDSFVNLWTRFRINYLSENFTPSECTSQKVKIDQKQRWQYHQDIDPSHLYYFRFSLPDSALLKRLVREKKIKVNKECPCELTQEGVIPLKPNADCSKYGFRLVAHYEKKPNVKIE